MDEGHGHHGRHDHHGHDGEHEHGLGALEGAVAAMEVEARLAHARLRTRDTTLWPPAGDVTAPWLGWLDSLDRAPAHLRRIRPLVAELVADGVRHAVLVGMGGSSLFPIVLAGVCPRGPHHPSLHVLDSTDPAAVARIEAEVDWARTVVVVASKSGTTVETLAHLDRFLVRLREVLGDRAPQRVLAVTDPGSPLEVRAASEGFRAVISGDPDVGGRYSALSPFGLLPAALIGADVERMLGLAREANAAWVVDPWTDGGPARIAALLAAGVAAGRDALHLVVDGRAGLLGAWIEQLVAESSGKDGTGVLPVVLDTGDGVIVDDRAVVVTIGDVPGVDSFGARGVPLLQLPWSGGEHLLVEALRWMQAVPLACAQLGVDPFDQPDVASAKAATARALAEGTEPSGAVDPSTLDGELDGAGYVALLAYVDPGGGDAAGLQRVADALARRHATPVTVGLGPRYLHSTGQLHKGGRTDGVFLVVVGEDPADIGIPGRAHGFSRLKRAQAAGDLKALRDSGRSAHVVRLDDLRATLGV
jgi:transaldolase/glucose-6-phosphate isomerase